MADTVAEFVGPYYSARLLHAVSSLGPGSVRRVASIVAESLEQQRRIFVLGNGGSQAVADDFLYFLHKFAPPDVPLFVCGNPTVCQSLEFPFDSVFNSLLTRSAQPGDLACLISSSGNSENVIAASTLCRHRGIRTISVSASGRLVSDPQFRPDVPICIDVPDQQIVEDAIMAFWHVVLLATEKEVNRTPYSAEFTVSNYSGQLAECLTSIDPSALDSLSTDLLNCYLAGRAIRLDAPDHGSLYVSIRHFEHNLKWDVFYGAARRCTNRVFGTLPDYHFSGVSNDGGYGYNGAIEIEDNFQTGDVQVIFCRSRSHPAVRAVETAGRRNGMCPYVFEFPHVNEMASCNAAQSLLHMTSRLVNAKLLRRQGKIGPDAFDFQLQKDLAFLRLKNRTATELHSRFGGAHL